MSTDRSSDRVIRFGVGLPNDPAMLRQACRRAEELGFDGLWTQDSLAPTSTALDGLHALSFAAAVTETIRLGIGVVYSAHRHPAVLAREVTTIDHLSGGRVILGMGVGNTYHRPRLDALGISTHPPIARLVEGIAVMRALWNDGPASYHGEIFDFSGVETRLKPVQRPGPPIWIGARVERALVRAVEISDGWLGAGPVGTAEFLEQFAVVRQALADRERDPATFRIGKGVYICVDSEESTAHEIAQRFFERAYGSNPVYASEGMAERVAVFGSVDRCAEQLRELIDAGVDELVLHPVHDPLEQLEALGGVVESLRQGG